MSQVAFYIYICLPILYFIYVLVTICWAFVVFGNNSKLRGLKQILVSASDKSSDLSKRSMTLAAISSLASVILCTDGWLRMAANVNPSFVYPCLASSILKYVGWPLQIGGFSLRAYRYWCQLELGRLRRGVTFAETRTSPKKGTLTSRKGSVRTDSVFQHQDPFLQRDIERIRLLEIKSNEMRLVKLTIVSSGCFLFANFLIGIPFGWYSDDFAETCAAFSNAYVMLFLIQGVYSAVVGPYLVWKFWNTSDAFFIKGSIVFSTAPALPAFILFLILQATLPHTDDLVTFDPTNLGFLLLVLAHTFNFVAPLIHSRKTNKRVSVDFAAFVDVLVNETEYEKLKSCAAEHFSIESVLFWENYMALIRQEYFYLVRQLEKHEYDAVTTRGSPWFLEELEAFKQELKNQSAHVLAKRFASGSNALTNSTSSSGLVVQEETDCFIAPMPVVIASALIRLHDSFVAPNAEFELNLSIAERHALLHVLSELSKRLAKLTKDPTIQLTIDDCLEDVFLEFGRKESVGRLIDGKLHVSAFIFNEIKSRAVWMVYENIFPRYLRQKSGSKAVVLDA